MRFPRIVLGRENKVASSVLTREFEYDASYFRSYDKRRPSVDDLYTRFLKWAGVLDGRGKTALDLGAAFGYAVELLERLGYRALGLEISRYACSRSRAVICGDAQAPPLREEYFDLITCFETIEHLAHPDRAIARFRGLLKDHGVLLITTPTPLGEKVYRRLLRHPPDYSTDVSRMHILNILIRALRVNTDDSKSHLIRECERGHHPSIRPCQGWVSAIVSAGFTNVKVREFVLTPVFLGKYRVISSPGTLAMNVMIRANK